MSSKNTTESPLPKVMIILNELAQHKRTPYRTNVYSSQPDTQAIALTSLIEGTACDTSEEVGMHLSHIHCNVNTRTPTDSDDPGNYPNALAFAKGIVNDIFYTLGAWGRHITESLIDVTPHSAEEVACVSDVLNGWLISYHDFRKAHSILREVDNLVKITTDTPKVSDFSAELAIDIQWLFRLNEKLNNIPDWYIPSNITSVTISDVNMIASAIDKTLHKCGPDVAARLEARTKIRAWTNTHPVSGEGHRDKVGTDKPYFDYESRDVTSDIYTL